MITLRDMHDMAEGDEIWSTSDMTTKQYSKWVEGSKNTGKDNCCWYLFDRDAGVTKFYGRTI